MPAFPATIAPSDIVAWFDSTRPEYSDSSGLLLAGPGDLIRRVDEASPLSALWASTSDAQRPRATSRFDAFGTTTPGTQMLRSATPALTSMNDATIVVSFLTRDGYGGPQMGLCACGSPAWGVYGGASGAGAYVNGGTWQAFGVNTVARAVKTSLAVRYGSTQVRAQMLAAGVTQTAVNTTSVAGGTLGSAPALAWAGASCQGQYGEIGQALIINRQLNDAETTALLAWCDAQTIPEGYPVTQPLIGIVGDSIARSGVGTTIPDSWWGRMLQTIRGGVSPGAEACNVSIVGAGVGNNAYTNQLQAFKSASRIDQIAVVALGTNNLANGQSAASVLAGLYALCDLMRAEGWQVVLQNILPRQGLFNAPGNQALFDAALPVVNADLASNWSSHADAFVDLASLAGLNDPANTTYYQVDKVHPTAAGQAAMSGPITAAVVSLLSPVTLPPATGRRFQMVGLGASGLVPWLVSDVPDWAGALAPEPVTDIFISSRSRI